MFVLESYLFAILLLKQRSRRVFISLLSINITPMHSHVIPTCTVSTLFRVPYICPIAHKFSRKLTFSMLSLLELYLTVAQTLTKVPLSPTSSPLSEHEGSLFNRQP